MTLKSSLFLADDECFHCVYFKTNGLVNKITGSV